MALKRLATSWARALFAEEFEAAVLAVVAVLALAEFSRVVSALCASVTLLSDSAVVTLERNCPNGLLESALEGVSLSNCAR